MNLALKPLPRMPLPVQPQPRPLKKTRKHGHIRNVYRLVFVIVVLGVFAFGTVAREAAIVAHTRTLRGLSAEIAALEAANAVLRVEISRLGSTAHIEQEAKERLGMRAPTVQQVLRLRVNSGGN